MLVYTEGGKPENPKKSREQTTNLTHLRHRAEIEPGSHWWEGSALTTAFHKDIRSNFFEILLVIRCFSYFFSRVFTVLPSSVGEQGRSTSS